MAELKTVARVILRPNGGVHIAFPDIRSVFATPQNLSLLFTDPFDFINNQSHSYNESTFEINRKRVALDDICGLTLASVNSDKQIICEFPELFSYVFSANENDGFKTTPLNMSSFEFETVLSDEKSFLLKYYLDFTSQIRTDFVIKSNLKLREEIQSAIIREILNMFLEDDLSAAENLPDISSKISVAESTAVFQSTESPTMVPLSVYAEKIGVIPRTVHTYIKNGRIKSAIKNSSGHYLVDVNETPTDWDLRKGRHRLKKAPSGEKHYKRPNQGSAADVEEHIKKQHLFSDKLAPYIRTFQEMNYYVKKNYHEVFWDGRPALIVDVNPDYISSSTGIRNRDLMLEGKPPVIPNRDREELRFHLHHVGQRSSSPFAIIPEYDHNSKELSSIFHVSQSSENLHGPEFEVLKKNFWKTYIEEYDRAGSYQAIEYTFPKKETKRKQ